jgi:DedD protein
MGLFSFGNKDDAPRRRGANVRSARAEGSRRRTERAADADAMLLDPTLPEKQRARRRLVGAIALVIAAVVILPMVLDSHPRPVTDDIAIDIPSRPATVPSRARDDAAGKSGVDKSDIQAGIAPDSATGPAAAATASASEVQSVARSEQPGGSGKSDSSANSDKASKSATKTASAAQETHTSASSKSATAATKTPSAKEDATAVASAKSAASAANERSVGSGASTAAPGARFAVQLGVFADDSNAKRWESKLKAAGVPAYVEHRKQADGSTRSMLRAGPFADRAAASAAIAKVREAGLTANSAQ